MRRAKKKQNFSERLRFWRKKRGLSQGEFAKKLSLAGNAQVSRYESGKSLPDFAVLTKITEVLKVDLHRLVTGQPSPDATKVVKILKPFVYAHLSEITQIINELEKERRELQTHGAKPMSTVALDKDLSLDKIQNAERLDEIQEELEDRHLYYKTVMDTLSELLQPLGEKL